MKKNMQRIIPVVIASVVFWGCSANRPHNRSKETTDITQENPGGQETDEMIEKTMISTEDQMTAESGKTSGAVEESHFETESEKTISEADLDLVEPYDLYEKCLEVATEQQKRQLLKMRNDSTPPEWRFREIKIIMGFISEDAPRLTLNDAKRICEEFSTDSDGIDLYKIEGQLAEKFNEIAGAPDEDGGSGLRHYIYYLNDDKSESISIAGYEVTYYNKTDGKGVILFDAINSENVGKIIDDSCPDATEPTLPEDVYFEEKLSVATDEQKQKLLSIRDDDYPKCYHVREIKTIMGEVDEKLPRLTIEKTLEICNEIEKKQLTRGSDAEKIILDALNKYAGAPDIEGVDEIPVHIYYFDNNNHSKYVTVMGFLVLYTDTEQNIEKYIYDYSNS